MNGWADLNSCLRQKIIEIPDVDIVCLTKTHLRNNRDISITGFSCFKNNRKGVSVHACKGSGGVALLVKDYLLQKHSLNLVDDNCEGIIGIELKNKQTNYALQVYTCYLSPVDSPHASTTFLVT